MTYYETPFIMSRHAIDQAMNMCVDGEDIRAAVLNPRHVADTSLDREMRTRGKLTVIVTKEVPMTVVTILWATANAWQTDHDTYHSRHDRDQDHVNAVRRSVKMQRRRTTGKRGYRK